MTHTLSDGRKLGLERFGRRGGHPVIALHGTPGSRLKYRSADAAAGARALDLVSLDRWGYGSSDTHPRPTLRAFADDVAEIADRLGIGRFSLIGISGGGPFAAAVAACRPDRVAALALVAPVGPIAELDAVGDGGFVPFHRFCFGTLPRIPGGVAATFALFRLIVTASPSAAVALASRRAGSRDRQLLTDPGLRADLGHAFKVGLAPGIAGPVIDMRSFSRPWSLPLDAVRAPTRIWIGEQDRNVPRAAVDELARAIPNAEIVRHGEGHFWIARGYPEVLDWIGAVSA